jgi:hypothetical protein
MLRKVKRHASRMGLSKVKVLVTIDVTQLVVPLQSPIVDGTILSVCFEKGGKLSVSKEFVFDLAMNDINPMKTNASLKYITIPIKERVELVTTMYKDGLTGDFQHKQGKVILRQLKRNSLLGMDAFKSIGVSYIQLHELLRDGPGQMSPKVFVVAQSLSLSDLAGCSLSSIITVNILSDTSSVRKDKVSGVVAAAAPAANGSRSSSSRGRGRKVPTQQPDNAAFANDEEEDDGGDDDDSLSVGSLESDCSSVFSAVGATFYFDDLEQAEGLGLGHGKGKRKGKGGHLTSQSLSQSLSPAGSVVSTLGGGGAGAEAASGYDDHPRRNHQKTKKTGGGGWLRSATSASSRNKGRLHDDDTGSGSAATTGAAGGGLFGSPQRRGSGLHVAEMALHGTGGVGGAGGAGEGDTRKAPHSLLGGSSRRPSLGPQHLLPAGSLEPVTSPTGTAGAELATGPSNRSNGNNTSGYGAGAEMGAELPLSHAQESPVLAQQAPATPTSTTAAAAAATAAPPSLVPLLVDCTGMSEEETEVDHTAASSPAAAGGEDVTGASATLSTSAAAFSAASTAAGSSPRSYARSAAESRSSPRSRKGSAGTWEAVHNRDRSGSRLSLSYSYSRSENNSAAPSVQNSPVSSRLYLH